MRALLINYNQTTKKFRVKGTLKSPIYTVLLEIKEFQQRPAPGPDTAKVLKMYILLIILIMLAILLAEKKPQ